MTHGLAGLEVSRVLYGVLERGLPEAMALRPIVEVATGHVAAHEALFGVPRAAPVSSRWPRGHRAARAGLLEPLEDRVAEACAGLQTGGLLFVNVHPAAAGRFDRWHLVARVVAELTEVASVDEDVVRPLTEAGIPSPHLARRAI